MKTNIALASVVAALSGFAGLASTANAGPDIHINARFGPPPIVVVRPPIPPAPAFGFSSRAPDRDYRDYRGAPAPRGYWKEEVIKRWVPAKWVVTRGYRGREHRVLREGYFTYRTDRVWVETGRGYGRG